MTSDKTISPGRVIGFVLGILALIIAMILPFKFLCTVEAGEIVIHQSVGGTLTAWNTPGWRWQGFGTITSYTKSDEFNFQTQKTEQGSVVHGTSTKNCIGARFNDQGQAAICGQLSYDLPLDSVQMIAIHEKYRSMSGIRERLIRPAVVKSIYNSGPLMSSRESAGQRRGDLIEFIRDQATRGVYQTSSRIDLVDDMTSQPIEVVEMLDTPKLDDKGQPVLENNKPIMIKKAVKTLKPRKKKVKIVEPKINDKGVILVQEESTTTAMGIKLFNITVENIVYEPKVKEQINKQRDMEMQIQTKISEAEQAKQDAITAEQKGKADAAKAKWKQETLKATAVTAAEQRSEVAMQDLNAAKLERQAAVERAKGEAESKELVMKADGALDKKLAAWVSVNGKYAAAFAKHPLVPSTVIGGDNKGGGSAATDLVNLMNAQLARQIGLNTNFKK